MEAPLHEIQASAGGEATGGVYRRVPLHNIGAAPGVLYYHLYVFIYPFIYLFMHLFMYFYLWKGSGSNARLALRHLMALRFPCMEDGTIIDCRLESCEASTCRGRTKGKVAFRSLRTQPCTSESPFIFSYLFGNGQTD